VRQEGDLDGFFDGMQDALMMDDDGNFLPEIDPEVLFLTNCAEDIALLCKQGYDVDNNNEPAPGKNPDASIHPFLPDNEGLFPGQQWGVQHHVYIMELHGSKKPPHFQETGILT
jgi:hypothetical protein